MKKKNLILIVAALVILIGAYLGYRNYNSKNTNHASNKTSVDKKESSNQTNKNSTNEKLKKTVMDKVAKAEATKSEADIGEARKSIDILPEGKDKVDLNKRLDKIAAGNSTVTWVKAPTYNGITTLITGSVDLNEVKAVKAYVENKEVVVTLNKDGTFSIDCNNIAAGKTVKIKAYDKNDKEVSSSDIVRAL